MPKVVVDDVVYNAAIEAVVKWGYTGATTRQIADTADISEVTLFRKYGNKAELLKQAIASMIDQMDFESATRYTGDVAADLLRVTRLYQGSAEKSGQFIYSILMEIGRIPELIEVIDRPVSMMTSIGQLLRRYQEAGILKEEHPMTAVAGLIGPLIALNIMRGADIGMSPPSIDLENHIATFLNGRYQQPN